MGDPPGGEDWIYTFFPPFFLSFILFSGEDFVFPFSRSSR